MENPNKYFQNIKIINFDIINHECRGNPLQKSYHNYYTIAKKLTMYQKKDKKEMVGAALRNQNKSVQPAFVEKNILKNHFFK